MTTCTCGLLWTAGAKAKICSHCDRVRVHDPSTCGRCKAIAVPKL